MGKFVKQMRFEVSLYKRLSVQEGPGWHSCPLIVAISFSAPPDGPPVDVARLLAGFSALESEANKLFLGAMLYGKADHDLPHGELTDAPAPIRYTQFDGTTDACSLANYVAARVARPVASRHNLQFLTCAVCFGVLEAAQVEGDQPAAFTDPMLLQEEQRSARKRGQF